MNIRFPNVPVLFLIAVLLLVFASFIPNTNAARTSDVWQERLGTYIETTWPEGRDILINGTNKYLNWGTLSGSSGYGIRDNGGTIEYKNNGGSWATFGLASLGADSVTPDNLLSTGQTDEYCLTYEATGDTWEWQVCGSGGGDSVSIDGVGVTDPDFVSTGDIDFVDTSNTITANINAGSIIETDLDGDVAPVDGDYLQYDSVGTNFTWRSATELVSDIGLSNVENTALSTWAGTTNLTTLGAITTGTWQATALTDSYVSDTLTIGASGSVADGALSAKLQAIAGLTPASSLIIGDGLGSWTTVTPANFITNNNILDTADIGVSVQAYDADLTTYAGITPSANVQSLLGAANYAAMRTLLDLEAGTDFYSISAADAAFQPLDADLTAIGELAKTDSNFIVGNGSTWVAESGATVRTSLGLGTLATLSSVDISDNTNLAAGRSLTLSGDSVEADAELYTDTFGLWFEDPTADDDFQSIFENDFGKDLTIIEISCESDQTVNLDLQVDDGTPADVNGTDLVCNSTGVDDISFAGDSTISDNETVDLAITSVSGTPTWVKIQVTYTIAD